MPNNRFRALFLGVGVRSSKKSNRSASSAVQRRIQTKGIRIFLSKFLKNLFYYSLSNKKPTTTILLIFITKQHQSECTRLKKKVHSSTFYDTKRANQIEKLAPFVCCSFLSLSVFHPSHIFQRCSSFQNNLTDIDHHRIAQHCIASHCTDCQST